MFIRYSASVDGNLIGIPVSIPPFYRVHADHVLYLVNRAHNVCSSALLHNFL